MSGDAILLETSHGVATATLNRPDRMNALDAEMRAAVIELPERLAAIDGLRCVLIKGAGKSFMAGGDVKAYHEQLKDDPAALSEDIRKRVRRMGESIAALRRLPAPVVAGVHGAVAGAGMGLMLACDIIVAAEDTVFTLAYSKLGTTPDFGVSWFLPRRIGFGRALELAATSERFDARKALDYGLVNRISAPGELESEAHALAMELADMPTQALGKLKDLMNASFENSLSEQIALEADSFADCVLTEDFAEGVGAFVEKRKANFKGS